MGWQPAEMARGVAQWLADLRSGHIPAYLPINPVHEAVAGWLRGDRQRCESLRQLILSRVEDRGLLPVSSNPHEVFVSVGRDREARELALLLLSLCNSPVASGSGELHGEYRGSREPSQP